MPDKFNELLLKPDIIELYKAGITPDYGYLMNGRFEKDMVKTLYPLKTLSGNPITWEASDTEYLFPVVSLEPKQAGSGDPSPENVRPISGYDSVTVTLSKDEAQVKQITLTLPETIYGGTVDAVTGEGRMDYKFIELNGTENWTYRIDKDYFEFNLFQANQYVPSSMNNIAQAKNTQYISHLNIGNPYSEAEDNIGWVFATKNLRVPAVRIRINAIASVVDLKTFLSTQQTEGTPLQVCYQLAEPEPFQATGNQALTSLLGYNTIYTNGDSITLN